MEAPSEFYSGQRQHEAHQTPHVEKPYNFNEKHNKSWQQDSETIDDNWMENWCKNVELEENSCDEAKDFEETKRNENYNKSTATSYKSHNGKCNNNHELQNNKLLGNTSSVNNISTRVYNSSLKDAKETNGNATTDDQSELNAEIMTDDKFLDLLIKEYDDGSKSTNEFEALDLNDKIVRSKSKICCNKQKFDQSKIQQRVSSASEEGEKPVGDDLENLIVECLESDVLQDEENKGIQRVRSNICNKPYSNDEIKRCKSRTIHGYGQNTKTTAIEDGSVENKNQLGDNRSERQRGDNAGTHIKATVGDKEERPEVKVYAVETESETIRNKQNVIAARYKQLRNSMIEFKAELDRHNTASETTNKLLHRFAVRLKENITDKNTWEIKARNALNVFKDSIMMEFRYIQEANKTVFEIDRQKFEAERTRQHEKIKHLRCMLKNMTVQNKESNSADQDNYNNGAPENLQNGGASKYTSGKYSHFETGEEACNCFKKSNRKPKTKFFGLFRSCLRRKKNHKRPSPCRYIKKYQEIRMQLQMSQNNLTSLQNEVNNLKLINENNTIEKTELEQQIKNLKEKIQLKSKQARQIEKNTEDTKGRSKDFKIIFEKWASKMNDLITSAALKMTDVVAEQTTTMKEFMTQNANVTMLLNDTQTKLMNALNSFATDRKASVEYLVLENRYEQVVHEHVVTTEELQKELASKEQIIDMKDKELNRISLALCQSKQGFITTSCSENETGSESTKSQFLKFQEAIDHTLSTLFLPGTGKTKEISAWDNNMTLRGSKSLTNLTSYEWQQHTGRREHNSKEILPDILLNPHGHGKRGSRPILLRLDNNILPMERMKQSNEQLHAMNFVLTNKISELEFEVERLQARENQVKNVMRKIEGKVAMLERNSISFHAKGSALSGNNTLFRNGVVVNEIMPNKASLASSLEIGFHKLIQTIKHLKASAAQPQDKSINGYVKTNLLRSEQVMCTTSGPTATTIGCRKETRSYSTEVNTEVQDNDYAKENVQNIQNNDNRDRAQENKVKSIEMKQTTTNSNQNQYQNAVHNQEAMLESEMSLQERNTDLKLKHQRLAEEYKRLQDRYQKNATCELNAQAQIRKLTEDIRENQRRANFLLAENANLVDANKVLTTTNRKLIDQIHKLEEKITVMNVYDYTKPRIEYSEETVLYLQSHIDDLEKNKRECENYITYVESENITLRQKLRQTLRAAGYLRATDHLVQEKNTSQCVGEAYGEDEDSNFVLISLGSEDGDEEGPSGEKEKKYHSKIVFPTRQSFSRRPILRGIEPGKGRENSVTNSVNVAQEHQSNSINEVMSENSSNKHTVDTLNPFKPIEPIRSDNPEANASNMYGRISAKTNDETKINPHEVLSPITSQNETIPIATSNHPDNGVYKEHAEYENKMIPSSMHKYTTLSQIPREKVCDNSTGNDKLRQEATNISTLIVNYNHEKKELVKNNQASGTASFADSQSVSSLFKANPLFERSTTVPDIVHQRANGEIPLAKTGKAGPSEKSYHRQRFLSPLPKADRRKTIIQTCRGDQVKVRKTNEWEEKQKKKQRASPALQQQESCQNTAPETKFSHNFYTPEGILQYVANKRAKINKERHNHGKNDYSDPGGLP